MPRKNNTPKHAPLVTRMPSHPKRRFTTRRQAEDAAEIQMLLQPRLELYVYQDIDRGWYLTRKGNSHEE